MAEINIETNEINLQSTDDSTLFSDQEKIKVEEVNFEFSQAHKLRGIYRDLMVFNNRHCYQSIKNKHQRKYKYRVDLAFLDPRPFREKTRAWGWLYAGIGLLAFTLVLGYLGWFSGIVSANSIYQMAFILSAAAGIMSLLLFFHKFQDKVIFRAEYSKVRLIELLNNQPDKQQFNQFLSAFVSKIKEAKKDPGLDPTRAITSELKDLRRLKDDLVLSPKRYERAKGRLFKNKAFNAETPAADE